MLKHRSESFLMGVAPSDGWLNEHYNSDGSDGKDFQLYRCSSARLGCHPSTISNQWWFIDVKPCKPWLAKDVATQRYIQLSSWAQVEVMEMAPAVDGTGRSARCPGPAGLHQVWASPNHDPLIIGDLVTDPSCGYTALGSGSYDSSPVITLIMMRGAWNQWV